MVGKRMYTCDSEMLNLTSHLAIQMQNLLDGDVDWADCRPQKRWSSLTCSDFLPDDSDVVHLHKRAVQLIMEVLGSGDQSGHLAIVMFVVYIFAERILPCQQNLLFCFCCFQIKNSDYP